MSQAPSPGGPGASKAQAVARGGTQADPEEELPGADIPPGENERPYPDDLPSPFHAGCNLDCLQTWHDWYFDRIQTVQSEEPDAADLLRQEKQAIDDQIRNAGGVPGEGPSTVVDEPGDLGQTTDGGQTTSGGSDQQSSQPSGGSPGIVSAVGTVVVDAISGAGPIVPENGPVDLGTMDLYTPLRNFADMMSLGGVSLLEYLYGDSGQTGTTTCPKGGHGDEVPLCPN